MMNKTYMICILVILNHLPTTLEANEHLTNTLNKMEQAYGGAVLKSIKAIKLWDYSKSLWPGQNEVPNLPDFWIINEELTIDFERQRKELISWRVDRTSKDLERFIVNKNSGRVFDVIHKKYFDDDWYNYSHTGRSVERSSDIFFAKNILDNKHAVELIGNVTYRGLMHDLLLFSLSDTVKYQIFIDSHTGLITQVSRNHPLAGEMVYVFSDHIRKDNVSFARDMNYFVGGQPRKISVYRNVEINPDLTQAFNPPMNYDSWGESITVNQQVHNELSKGVYHVGVGRSFALFIDAGDYYIAIGGDRALADNFRSLQQYLDMKKPLKYAVLTHHHAEHLNMIKPALSLGAQVVTVNSNKPIIKKHLSETYSEDKFVWVESKFTLMSGDLIIYDIPSAHSAHNLVAYLPNNQLLYAEDHYESSYQQSPLRVYKGMQLFMNELDKLGLSVEIMVDGGSSKIVSYTDLKQLTDQFKESQCPEGYQVCANHGLLPFNSKSPN